MKTRDVFAGCSVTVAPHGDVWLVSLNTDDLSQVVMKTYHDLPDALEAVHDWMLMLSDETEINIDADAHRRVAGLKRPYWPKCHTTPRKVVLARARYTVGHRTLDFATPLSVYAEGCTHSNSSGDTPKASATFRTDDARGGASGSDAFPRDHFASCPS
jgi:hypothetical protein